MIAASIVAHLIGDYLIQSHWMATQKTNRWLPAILHGITYTIPFLFITQSWSALAIIAGTHIIIDKYRLAKYITWLKNQAAPKEYRPTWEESKDNAGYTKDVPAWMSIWLMFIADNTLHICINIAAIYYLG